MTAETWVAVGRIYRDAGGQRYLRWAVLAMQSIGHKGFVTLDIVAGPEGVLGLLGKGKAL